MKLNVAKTKVLHFGYESDSEAILILDGTTIDVCDIFNYLGLPTLSSRVAIRQRFAAVWSAIVRLRPIFYSTAQNSSIIKFFKSAVKTIAAYVLESLLLNPMMSNILDAGQSR